MELQWPLIIFTTLLAWSAGLFAAQGIAALRGKITRSQLPALVTSAVLLVVGGISVVFHLEHWERIFNGFGNPTSGITQELVAIVVMAVVMVVFFAYLRRDNGTRAVPTWVAVLAIISAVVLVVVMAHSYMMSARPMWNSVLWIVYVLGNACLLGPATLTFIDAVRGEDTAASAQVTVIAVIAGAVIALAYALWLQFGGGAFSEVGYYYDPTHPTYGMMDVMAATDVAGGSAAMALWLGALGVGALVPLAAALVAWRKGGAATWKVAAVIIVVAALVGAVCMRMVFYQLGLSLFAIF